MGNNRISILVALDGADEGLKRAIASAERSLGELVASAKSAGEKAAAGLAQVKAGVSVISDGHHRQDTTARFPLDQLAVGKTQEIVQVADAWNILAGSVGSASRHRLPS